VATHPANLYDGSGLFKCICGISGIKVIWKIYLLSNPDISFSMKWLVFVFIFYGSPTFSQTLKEKVQGEWVCRSITDSVGHETDGDLGAATDYLKFKFKGSRLYIIQAPFDVGTTVWLNFRDNYFELTKLGLTQLNYRVISISENEMILRTVNLGKTKNYHFVNQKIYALQLNQLSNFRNFGQIIVRFTSMKDSGLFFQDTFYQIDNSILNLVPSPQFNGGELPTFRNYLDSKFFMPKSFNTKEVPNELIIEFDVLEDGMQNIEIVKRLDNDLDTQVFDIMKKVSEQWIPLMHEEKVIETRIRLRFLFMYIEI
jgi:hypothetical protein